MKPVLSTITSFLSLALLATAAPAVEKRWCYPVCCCNTPTPICEVDTVCSADEVAFDGGITYCCHQDLFTANPVEIAELYASGQCYLQTPVIKEPASH